MRVFTTKHFRRFVKDNQLPEDSLCEAIRELSIGLVHASLGGSVFKQRIARKGQGKSGGFRTIIFFKVRERAFFIYGFAKNVQENVGRDDLAELKNLAKEMLHYDDKTLSQSIQSGELVEICTPQVP
jgi:hypothetical protein